MRHWPQELCDQHTLFVHTLLRQSENDLPEYALIRTTEEVRPLLARRPLVFTGHIHEPGYWDWDLLVPPRWHAVVEPTRLVLQPARRYLVQVGSLGEPVDPAHPRYLVWDDEGFLEWRSLQAM